MKSLPFLIVASAFFISIGLVMVVREIAGGFIFIPLGLIFVIRAIYVSRTPRL